jgi:hypothetical protein
VIIADAGLQEDMARWLCERIDLIATPMIVCVGNVIGNKLRAVVGYDNHNGACCTTHIAGEGNWLTRDFLHSIFHYPFEICKYNVILALIPSGNKRSLALITHFGFEVLHSVAGGHPDGSLYIMGMRREQCRYLRKHNGKEIIHTHGAGLHQDC